MTSTIRALSCFAIFFLVGCGSGSSSGQRQTTQNPPPASVPSAPGSVLVIAGDRQLTVTWSPVSTATSYTVYWGTTSAVTPANATRVTTTGSSRIISGLTNGVTYHLTVTSANSAGESSMSTVVSATPTSAEGPPAPGWTPQTLINLPFDFFDTDLYVGDVDINDLGQAAAVWVEEGSDSDSARVVVNLYDGAAWGTPVTLATDGARSPTLAITPLGDVVVCYTQRGFDANGFMLNETVWSRRYVNGSWTTAEQIDGADLSAFLFMYGIDLVADGSGNVMATWVEDNTKIWAARYGAQANGWSAPVLLTTSIRTLEQAALGVDGSGIYTAVWLDSTEPFDSGQSGGGPSRHVLYASRYQSGSWSAPRIVGHDDLTGFDGAERAAVTVNADGVAVAVWEQVRNPGANPTWSVDSVRYENGSWGMPETIVSQSTYTSWPDVAIDSAGNVIASWQPTDPADGSDNVAAVAFYVAGAASWSAPVTVNGDLTFGVDNLFVGRDVFGESLAIWNQSRIMARRFDGADVAAPVDIIGTRTGQALAFASSPNGHAVVITDHMIMNNADWRRSVWANVYSP